MRFRSLMWFLAIGLAIAWSPPTQSATDTTQAQLIKHSHMGVAQHVPDVLVYHVCSCKCRHAKLFKEHRAMTREHRSHKHTYAMMNDRHADMRRHRERSLQVKPYPGYSRTMAKVSDQNTRYRSNPVHGSAGGLPSL